MNRWLAIAELLCGAHARRDVFEPLVADWQRQWHDAPDAALARARIVAGGCGALLVAIAVCALTGGADMNRTTMIRGVSALVISTAALLAISMLINQQLPLNAVFELRLWTSLSRTLPLMIPLAVLPLMMMLRGRGAAPIVVVACAAALTVVVAGWLAPKTYGDLPVPLGDRVEEAMYQRAFENDRAGLLAYPGSAYRSLQPSTPEQRAAAREKWRSDPRYVASQARIKRPRWTSRTFILGGLTIALGTLGWALGALGRTSAIHAVAWWMLACVTLLAFDGQIRFQIDNIGLIQIPRAPNWAPLALFGAAALALLLRARRRGAPTP